MSLDNIEELCRFHTGEWRNDMQRCYHYWELHSPFRAPKGMPIITSNGGWWTYVVLPQADG